jgi:glutathione S-transferase
MIELYGSPASSSGRSRWMIEETGVPYEYKRIDVRAGQCKTPEFTRLYGGATVPVLRDGDFVLGESIAINFYLAEKHAPELLPSDLALRGQCYQWSLWAITNVQPELLSLMFDAMKPSEQRNPSAVDAAKLRLAPQLAFLDQALEGHDYLVGDRFSVADVNAGSVLNIARFTGSLSGSPNAGAWLERLVARPAFQRAATP